MYGHTSSLLTIFFTDCTYRGMIDTENRTERFEMRMSASDLEALDRLRKAEDDLPSRAEMIRRLIVEAVAARKRKRT